MIGYVDDGEIRELRFDRVNTLLDGEIFFVYIISGMVYIKSVIVEGNKLWIGDNKGRVQNVEFELSIKSAELKNKIIKVCFD